MSQTAKDQYAEYIRDGKEQVPFYQWPVGVLREVKGEVDADLIIAHYQRFHKETPCVRDGVLFSSIRKEESQKP